MSNATIYGETMKTDVVQIRAELTDTQAWQVAQFLKRVTFSQVRQSAEDDDTAYQMIEALEVIHGALAKQGYAPR